MPHNSFIEDRMKEFENTFVYKAYGILEGEGRAMQIRRQDEYKPLTYENVFEFFRTSLTKLEQETEKRVREEVLREIGEALIQKAEPYDGAGWHNPLQIGTILKIINDYSSSHNINLSKE